MRTVFVFPDVSREEAVKRLNGLARAYELPDRMTEWIFQGVLWIRLQDKTGGLYDDWDLPACGALARSHRGELPGWAVVADVSSRVTGQDQVRQLVTALVNDDGLVVDDFSDEVWPAADIASGAVHYGWPGFAIA